jgi:hypothetical protein
MQKGVYIILYNAKVESFSYALFCNKDRHILSEKTRDYWLSKAVVMENFIYDKYLLKNNTTNIENIENDGWYIFNLIVRYMI